MSKPRKAAELGKCKERQALENSRFYYSGGQYAHLGKKSTVF
jgi:hypothetical protein